MLNARPVTFLPRNRAFATGLHVRWRPVALFFTFTLSGWRDVHSIREIATSLSVR
jgi:hypothetical protein